MIPLMITTIEAAAIRPVRLDPVRQRPTDRHRAAAANHRPEAIGSVTLLD